MKPNSLLKLGATIALASAEFAPNSSAGTTASMDGALSASSTMASPSSGSSTGWNFQIALSYAGGLNDLSDTIEEHNPLYDLDTLIPVGISFYPYYEFSNGVGVGMEIGPAIVGLGDANFYVVPLSLDLRYTFMRDSKVSPYIRTGVQYAFAGGDFIETGDVGFYAKAGLEFGHSSNFGWGLEVGYSSSTVEVLPGGGKASEDVEPYNFTVGAFVRF